MKDISLIEKIIQIESLSGKEGELSDYLSEFLLSRHWPVQIINGNLVLFVKGKDSRQALIFNAHLDTVGAGDCSKWQYPPTGTESGRIIGNKIFGLGASDCKAGIASILGMIAEYQENGQAPPIDLWVALVVKEESDGSGTEDFLKWFPKKKYKNISGIIAEPTSLNSMEIGHRGNFFLTLKTFGNSGHAAGEYKESDLAWEKMFQALAILKKSLPEWQKKFSHKFLGKPTLNITAVHSGAAFHNKIPDHITAQIDLRTTFLCHSLILKEIVMKLEGLATLKISENPRAPGWTNAQSRIAKAVKSAAPKVRTAVSLGSTDLGIFNEFGIEAVVFGPGEKGAIHRENEYAYISKVTGCAKLYKKIIDAYASN